MRSFFERLAWKTERFMQGRNGQDDLARTCYYAGFVLLIVSLFCSASIAGTVINILAFALLFYSIFRMLSRNTAKRSAENQAYLNKTAGIREKASQQKLRFDERKEYKFCKCKCGTTLRFRRGQGTRDFTCPKCKAKLTVKT